MAEILVVDDERYILKTLSLLLKGEGHDVTTADSVEAAGQLLKERLFDLVLTDLRLGESDGQTLIRMIRDTEHPAECIVMTAYGTIESAVECMRLGAFDYLTKPVNPQELLVRVQRVLEKKRLSDEVIRLREEVGARLKLSEIVSASPEMQNIVGIVHRIRNLELPVLITGETGTGKEIIAQSIHNSSRRSNGPFLAVNCCTLPNDLLDSELFGHVKGAFTGATSASRGLFQQAHGGTLFLDEIGDISAQLQSKLLRVLQEGIVRPVGSERSEKVDVRIIAATNRDLQSMIAMGEFRSDLFFRLNVVPISLPPLRERPEDIRPLIERSLDELRAQIGPEMPALSKDAWQKLLMYHYPGNIRQLKNVIERTFALAQGTTITADDVQLDEDFPDVTLNSAEPEPESTELEEMITRHIRLVLTLHQGNQVAAAKALGISRSTLRRKLGLS